MSKPLFWLDLEMTGLDEKKDKILEIAMIITDSNLNVIGDRYSQVVYQPQELLDNMNDWCKKTHGDSGLTKLVPEGKPLEEVEKEVVTLINRYRGSDPAVIAGNSIWNDRKFIDFYMPKLSETLHYRMVDVSAFKEMVRRLFKVGFQKKNAHRAIDDIYESIEELKFYLSFFDKPKMEEVARVQKEQKKSSGQNDQDD